MTVYILDVLHGDRCPLCHRNPHRIACPEVRHLLARKPTPQELAALEEVDTWPEPREEMRRAG